MIVKAKDAEMAEIKAPRGGAGIMKGFQYLGNANLEGKLNGFFINELEKDAEVGYHQHIGNEEIYFIVSGEALVKDNDIEEKLFAGDLVYTADGESHGIKNIGEGPLKFVAFIINK